MLVLYIYLITAIASAVAAAPKLLRISNVSESTRGWMTLVHVVEADRVKVASHGSISKSFRLFRFGDSQVPLICFLMHAYLMLSFLCLLRCLI